MKAGKVAAISLAAIATMSLTGCKEDEPMVLYGMPDDILIQEEIDSATSETDEATSTSETAESRVETGETGKPSEQDIDNLEQWPVIIDDVTENTDRKPVVIDEDSSNDKNDIDIVMPDNLAEVDSAFGVEPEKPGK